MGEDVADIDDLPSVLHYRDQAVLVAADIQNGNLLIKAPPKFGWHCPTNAIERKLSIRIPD